MLANTGERLGKHVERFDAPVVALVDDTVDAPVVALVDDTVDAPVVALVDDTVEGLVGVSWTM